MIKYFSAATGYSKMAVIAILACSLIVHFICAWHSIGFYHYDEHYQILEFANYKAGFSSAEDLAWEFDAQIRPTIQPWIAYFTIQLHSLFRPHDSFTVAGILRFITAILGFGTSLLVTAASFKWITEFRLRKLALWLSFFLWFIMFMDARFSSESWAGIFFFSALALLIIKDAFYPDIKPANAFFIIGCGFLLGLSLVFRLQMILAFPGLAIWCLFVARTPIKVIVLLVIGGLLGIALGFVSDYFFYGNWVNTAYRYFTINILEGKAAEFGVSPWWFYIPEFLKEASLPSSFIILLLVVIAWFRYPTNILTLTCVPFVVLHMFIAHKELRFLFPIAHAMPVFLVFGVQYLLSALKSNSYQRASRIFAAGMLIILGVQNLILLVQTSTSPVRPIIKPVALLYKQERNKQINVIITDIEDYELLTGLPMNFYVPENMKLVQHGMADSIHAYLDKIDEPAYLIVRNRGKSLKKEYSSLQKHVISMQYALPAWYKFININNWQERTTLWKIYKLSPEAVNT